jgi:hypothetical protein
MQPRIAANPTDGSARGLNHRSLPRRGKELDLFLKDHMKTLKNFVYGVLSTGAIILRYSDFCLTAYF